MTNSKNCIIYLLLLTLLLVSGYASSNETNKTNLVTLSLTQVINIPWNMSLEDIENQYPGGHFNKGDLEKRTVQNYILPFFLKDLKTQARLNFFNVFRKNYIEKSTKLIKTVNINFDNFKSTKDTVEILKENLKQNFPHGGPSLLGKKQVGYFIPINENFDGIGIRWSVSNESKTIQVTMQETK